LDSISDPPWEYRRLRQVPWRECCAIDERLKVVVRLLDGEKMAT